MSAREWIAARRELLDAATEGPWELRSYMDREYSVYAPRWLGIVAELGIGAEDTALIADARTSLPRALDALEAVLKEAWRIESGHHFHGIVCICGYASHLARDRTEHLTRPLTDAIEAALRAES